MNENSLAIENSWQKLTSLVWEFFVFGLKEARSCIFPALFILVLIASYKLPLYGLPRYDFIFLAAMLIQILLVAAKIESLSEAVVLSMFHALGLALELFKTHPEIRSWSYPEAGFFKIGTVPLYSGFMYASVASYMCQAWKVFDLRLINLPSYFLSVPLCAAIYLNFFTHHFSFDLRWWLALGVIIVFWKTKVEFRVIEKTREMPLLLAFFLIGFFVWVAENIATFFGAWVYPEQTKAWTFVSVGKISSWVLLVIISFVIVADLKHFREEHLRSSRHEGVKG